MHYMHIETGSVDTKEGWILSYIPDLLEEEGLTAAEAFEEDEGVTLLRVTRKNTKSDWVGVR